MSHFSWDLQLMCLPACPRIVFFSELEGIQTVIYSKAQFIYVTIKQMATQPEPTHPGMMGKSRTIDGLWLSLPDNLPVPLLSPGCWKWYVPQWKEPCVKTKDVIADVDPWSLTQRSSEKGEGAWRTKPSGLVQLLLFLSFVFGILRAAVRNSFLDPVRLPTAPRLVKGQRVFLFIHLWLFFFFFFFKFSAVQTRIKYPSGLCSYRCGMFYWFTLPRLTQ